MPPSDSNRFIAETPATLGRRWWPLVASTLLLPSLAMGALCNLYRLTPFELMSDGLRVVATPMLAALYEEDTEQVNSIVQAYRHGDWASLRDEEAPPPFVYERPDAPHLVRLRATFALDQIAARASTEYEAMLAVGGWVGSQFDHGTDPVAGGDKGCDPVALVELGRQGRKYWCEIAARLMVHAAASLGWPARIITASTDGRTWEHAVAEVWSNEHAKWFVIDPDFNVVYESEGRPLSALDLLRDGARLRAAGRLRVRPIARPKPSIPPGDPLDLYRYIHVDMRTDWCSRSLRRGSPAGGDRATWWTARPDFRRLLTSRPRVDEADRFEWTVNRVRLDVSRARAVESPPVLDVALSAYSPYFEAFDFRMDGGPWLRTVSTRVAIDPAAARVVEARVVTWGGWHGPVSSLTLSNLDAPR